MGSVPLVALEDWKELQNQQSQPDPLTRFMQARQQQQLGQQQLQAGAQENQVRAMQIQDAQASTAAMRSWDGQNIEELPSLLLKHGASAQAVMGAKSGILDYQTKLATKKKTELENEQTQNDYIAGHIDAVKSLPVEQQPPAFEAAKQDLVQRGYLDQQQAQGLTYQGPEQLDFLEKHYVAHSNATEQALKAATTREQAANAGLAEIKLNLSKNSKPGDFDSTIDQVVPRQLPNGEPSPNSGLNLRTKAMVNFSLQRGDVEGAQKAIQAASEQIGSTESAVAKETNPAIQSAKLHLATATKAAEQAIADGDPRAAAQLLISGTVAPSQLVSSRKPAFAQQAFTAAAQMQPGWNAQKSEGDFKVASGPGNVAFFGSAKSLTDKGGTLDQLADAAKDIPANQIPVFNTVQDALKASTGSGPVAKYAAIALGVADDYAKVMGGGQGSDTSRTQALNLISAKQSPQQRAASIEGIRGSVASQTNSRIGNNTVLRQMYGGGGQTQTTQGGPPAGATMKVPGSDGKMHWSDGKRDLGIAQ
jgi:hypothetical protein